MFAYGHEELSDLSTAHLSFAYLKYYLHHCNRSWLFIGIFLWNCGFRIGDLTEGRFWTGNWLLIASLVPFWFSGIFFSPRTISISSSLFPCTHEWRRLIYTIFGAPVPPWDACWIVLLERLLQGSYTTGPSKFQDFSRTIFTKIQDQ